MKLKSAKSLHEIAEIIGVEYESDTDLLVTGINEIHLVESGDLTFVDHPKYYDKALNSKASFVIINKKVAIPPGKALLFSDDPFRDYNFLTRFFNPFQALSQHISPSAKIGENCIIQPGVVIGNNVTLGDNCTLMSNVVIYDGCQIGNNVLIHANTVIGSDGFYFKRRPDFYDKMHSCGSVIIHDNVEIGAACTIDRGVSGNTEIGNGTKLDNQIHIGHDTVVGKNVLMAAQCAIAGVTTIEDDVILWGQVGVQKDLVIGKGAIVYAKSGVGKNLEPGKVYFGSPAREFREVFKELAAMKYLPELVKNLGKK